MKSKFVFLTKESLKKKVCTKWFVIINILLLILIPCITNLDSIIKFFGGDFDEPVKIMIVDDANVFEKIEETVNNGYLSVLENYNAVVSKSDKGLDELKKEIIDDKKTDIIVHIIPSDNVFDAKIISFDYIDTILYQNITNALNTVKSNEALIASGIDMSLLENIYKGVNVERELLNKDLKEDEELMSFIGGIIIAMFIIPFFFLIILIVQMIGAEINEEKTSKSMEIIISSVSPQTHFMSKLVSSNLFAIIQGALLVFYAAIGIIVRLLTTKNALSIGGIEGSGEITSYINAFLESDVLNTIISGIPLFIIIMLLSFLAYSLLTGILASMTTSMEDYQQIQTPVMLFLVVGYYLAIIASVYDGATFIKIVSFVPLISGILAPVLFTLGQITILDLWISIALLAVLCYLLYKYGLKIYKVGILNYSSKNLWKKIFKSLKE